MIELRDVNNADREMLREWRNRPDVAAYMYSDGHIDEQVHNTWFTAAMGDPRRKYWIIVCDGRDVGLVNLYDIDQEHKRCFWAFYLTGANIRGKGVGSWVEYTILHHVFDKMKLTKLSCEVLDFNEAVVAMHTKFGFREEGRFVRHIQKEGKTHDVLRMATFAEDWQTLQHTLKDKLVAKGVLT